MGSHLHTDAQTESRDMHAARGERKKGCNRQAGMGKVVLKPVIVVKKGECSDPILFKWQGLVF